ncbi:type VII secretion system-associated protein [Streptomyces xiamenensis]|uniref:type VII secretion system-associated protein n=1 Tax=Streptomyces xiamenensis TaxID=408015 RepID=UPI0035D9272F
MADAEHIAGRQQGVLGRWTFLRTWPLKTANALQAWASKRPQINNAGGAAVNESSQVHPPISDAMRAQAAKAPGSWVYAVDPYFNPNGRVPPYGIIGAWEVDDHGNITDNFRLNPKYRPSPRARGMEEPTDHLDSMIQLASTGYASDLELQNALTNSIVYVIPERFALNSPGVQDEDRPFVGIYTSPRHAPNTVPEVQRILLQDVVRNLPDNAIIKLNPHSSVSVQVIVADIRQRP